MTETPPRPFAYKVGDLVTYTNGNGIKTRAKIRGFANPPHGGSEVVTLILGNEGKITGRETSRTRERFVYLEFWSGTGWRVGMWWFPVEPGAISDLKEVSA